MLVQPECEPEAPEVVRERRMPARARAADPVRQGLVRQPRVLSDAANGQSRSSQVDLQLFGKRRARHGLRARVRWTLTVMRLWIGGNNLAAYGPGLGRCAEVVLR